MNAKRALEYAVGSALLLGPFAYALTLPRPGLSVPVNVIAADGAEAGCTIAADPGPTSAPEPEPEIIVIDMCEPEPDAAVPLSELPPHTGEFLFVHGPNLVLSAEAEPDWGIGALFEPPGRADFRAGKRAWERTLPELYPAMATRSYDLYGSEGKLCSATVGELRVVAQYEGPTLQEVVGWDVYEELDDWDELPASTREIRRALWDTQPLWLVGELVTEGDCEGALWARDSELPAPAVLRRSEQRNWFGDRLIAEFEGSEARAELEAEHRGYLAELGEDELDWYPSWESIVEDAPAEVHSWLDARGEPRVLELEFGYSESCGGPDARYTKVHAVDEKGRVRPAERRYGADAIFDADLDGEFEYLYRDYDQRWSAEVASASEHLQGELEIAMDSYCPC